MKRSGLPVPRRAGGPGALGGAARSCRGWGSGLPAPPPLEQLSPRGELSPGSGERWGSGEGGEDFSPSNTTFWSAARMEPAAPRPARRVSALGWPKERNLLLSKSFPGLSSGTFRLLFAAPVRRQGG